MSVGVGVVVVGVGVQWGLCLVAMGLYLGLGGL